MVLAKSLLLLGTNLGERGKNLKSALELIESECGIITSQSSVYETEPWGTTSSKSYFNQAIIIDTLLNPFNLLISLQNIELQLGRVRETKWADRTIDIDILMYNDFVLDSQDLQIPHPQLPNRKFSLIPSCEIAPDWEHPLFHKKIHELLELCADKCFVTKVASSLF